MRHEQEALRLPYGGGHYALHRGGQGIYWQAGHGVVVRVAAAEQVRELHSASRPDEDAPQEARD